MNAGSDLSGITQRRSLRDLSRPRVAFEDALATHSQVLGEFFLARFLGFEVRYDGESCIVEFQAREDLQNPRGLLHGGVIATALDVAMGHLVQHLTHDKAATVNLNFRFHQAVSAGALRAIARVVHKASTLWSLDATLSNEAGEPIASATAIVASPRRDAAPARQSHSRITEG